MYASPPSKPNWTDSFVKYNFYTIGQTIDFSITTTDLDNDPVYYQWNLNGSLSNWLGPYTADEEHIYSTSFNSPVYSYGVKVRVKDDPNGDGDLSDGTESEWSLEKILWVSNPPTPPQLQITEIGSTETTTSIQVKSSDEDTNTLVYFIEWGDGSTDQTYKADQDTYITVNHVYEQTGTYNIRARARERYELDIYNPAYGHYSQYSLNYTVDISINPNAINFYGPSVGRTNQEYTFSLSIDEVTESYEYLIDWGDEQETNWLGPLDPGETTQITHLWATDDVYNLRVKIRDAQGVESQWTSPRIITITDYTQQPQLVLNLPSSVVEGQQFTITILSDQTQEPVNNAIVTFNGQTQSTNEQGTTIFTAPTVQQNQWFSVSVSKDDFQPTNQLLLITTLTQQANQGWIFGTVQNNQGTVLTTVQLCAISSEDLQTTTCVQTDADGMYVLSVPPGSYTLSTAAQGYQPLSKNQIVVEKDTAKEVNFILNTVTTQENDETELLDYIIEQSGQRGIAGAKLTIQPQTATYDIYQEELEITITEQSMEQFSFTVSADDGTQGTIVFVHVQPGVFTQLEDLDNLDVFFDEHSIEKVGVSTLLSLTSESSPKWAGIVTLNEQGQKQFYVMVYIPHFSEHHIMLSPQQIPLSTIAVIGFYLSFFLLIGLLILSPAIGSSLYQTYLKKQK